jgi:aspartyl-tRNA(Asn)/glutamyl-tRNA(Gln) amidotransferase subunit B
VTVPQRGKEHAHDYRYFPEPDLPPLVIAPEHVESIRAQLPELPAAKRARLERAYGLSRYDASLLVEDQAVADYFEKAVSRQPSAAISPKTIANWMTGEMFRLMKETGRGIENVKITPENLAALVGLVSSSVININTAKTVFTEMFATGRGPQAIVNEKGLAQVSDDAALERLVDDVLASNPEQVKTYLGGKETVAQWFFGQVMKQTQGRGNPQVIRQILAAKLQALKQRASS